MGVKRGGARLLRKRAHLPWQGHMHETHCRPFWMCLTTGLQLVVKSPLAIIKSIAPWPNVDEFPHLQFHLHAKINSYCVLRLLTMSAVGLLSLTWLHDDTTRLRCPFDVAWRHKRRTRTLYMVQSAIIYYYFTWHTLLPCVLKLPCSLRLSVFIP